MSPLCRLLLPLCLWLAAPAAAQTVVTSTSPDSVDVTIYRDPNRPASRQPNLRWLNGYALVSETRRVALPAGESEIRFEGVAGGILPQSAIVTGLPEGIVERNRDAYLLSPGSLLDRSLGRRVHLRRTSLATGEVTEQEAVIRSGAQGAVVLETAEGYETLRCTGIPETLVYDEVPEGLSARPTLSVRARSSQPVTATVTLSYLATGFDWQANYVAYLEPGTDELHLFAWLTLASTDETSFVEADTQAVAGRLNWTGARAPPSEGPPLTLRCWPSDTTSDIPEEMLEERIVVTGSRRARADVMSMSPTSPAPPPPPPPPAMVAEQEELGDLKLYRIPEPVTVAAHAQKQVALLERPDVEVDFLYRARLVPLDRGEAAAPARRMLVTRNRAEEGLGLPLPAGRMVLFAPSGDRQILIGEGFVADRAVGEDVEVDLGPATGVNTLLRLVERNEERREYELTVANDRAAPVAFEAEIMAPPNLVQSAERLGTRDGRKFWSVTIPANGRATLRYRLAASP